MSHYLTFVHNNFTYGIPAEMVEEIFFLPQLSPIPEAPDEIIGAVNVRGEIILIMDLNLRFGYESIGFSTKQSIVIIKYQKLKVGIIASKVNKVTTIDDTLITSELLQEQTGDGIPAEKFIAGVVQQEQEDNFILLLQPETLLRYTESQELSLDLDFLELELGVETESIDEENLSLDLELEGTEEIKPNSKLAKKTLFFPQASEYERKLLQKRADELRESSSIKDLSDLIPIAVFSLNKEFFGIELSAVEEFIDFERFTPIPCTPDFMLGNINVRGEVVTVVDIRGEFNLPLGNLNGKHQAVIVNLKGFVMGIVIDHLIGIHRFNINDLRSQEIDDKQQSNSQFLQGFIPYQEQMLSVINLWDMIENGHLIVDEAV